MSKAMKTSSATNKAHTLGPADDLDSPRQSEETLMSSLARLLDSSGSFRTLRRLEPRTVYCKPDGTPTRRAVFIDVETTGLCPATDEIVEISMVPFDYTLDGRIFAVHEPFERYRDPGRPIPAEVAELTGVKDADVAGQTIESAEIEAFLRGAVLIIAHNAGFDRKFAERLCPIFRALPWSCSWAEIDWRAEGFLDGAKLANLAAASGFFYRGHRATDDCYAGIEMLSRRLRSGRLALDLLLESARMPRRRVYAVGAPFAAKSTLRANDYRWNDGANGRPRAWFKDIPEPRLEQERHFLRREIYRRDDAEIEEQRIDAYDRYSIRA